MDPLHATSQRLRDLGLVRATLLIDERRVQANIARYAARARASRVTLRPHFKTHQSAAVAALFRAAGVTRATVSSLGQAAYFADHGWNDLTLAVIANGGEVAAYSALAARIRLGLLVDAGATVAALADGLEHPARIWLEVDTGGGRTGVPWDHPAGLIALARKVDAAPGLELAGLLTHAGHGYRCADPAAAAAVFTETRARMQAARAALADAGFTALALSAGDTPGFAAVADWAGLDEARPGNFVFHDLMQLAVGACTAVDLACAVACPVIGVYPDRGQVIVHAGAVHLSREYLPNAAGDCYGRLLTLTPDGFGDLLTDWSVVSLSQEHGVLATTGDASRLRHGDLVLIVPVHACLTCEQFASYRTLAGADLGRYRRR